MSSEEGTPNSIKRRLRSAGKEYAEHTLETAKNAAKGLQNTHAAYLYPLKVSVQLDTGQVTVRGYITFVHILG